MQGKETSYLVRVLSTPSAGSRLADNICTTAASFVVEAIVKPDRKILTCYRTVGFVRQLGPNENAYKYELKTQTIPGAMKKVELT